MTTRKKTADNDTTSVDSSSPLPDEELLGLRRLLLRAKGFALAFVRSNVPAESQRIAGELVTSLALGKVPIRELRLNEKVEDLYAEASTLDPALESGEALVVIGFERSIPSGVDFPTALKRLNLQRERFRELPCALVLILPDYALDLLARKAPDFWAWRSGVFETQPIAQRLDQTVLNSSLPAFIGLSALSIERKNAHLAVLRSTLADLDRQGPGTETDRSELSVRIAVILQAIGEPQEALAHAQAALDLAGKDLRTRAYALGQIADILYARGDLDEAMRIRQDEQIPVFEKLGDVRSRALTMGKIADILYARGDLDEAMRIRQDEQIPVYEKLGDVRSRAVTMGKIADILYARGDLDEAMRIRQDEQIPVFEKLGDVRSRALTMGKIADILYARGDLDEAMRIRQDEQIPVYEKLGDVRSRAVTMGQIADILYARGDLDEAMRIRQDEQIPVFEKLGSIRDELVARSNLALILLDRGQAGDSEKASNLLAQALADAKRLQLPEAAQIRDLIKAHGLEADERD